MARRIKKAIVKRLALCKRGKNKMTTLFKSDGTFEVETLVKGDTEKGELTAVMWPKGLADMDGDLADTAEAITSMGASLIQNGGALDIEHDGKVLPPEAAYVTEVFTIQKSDERFADWKDYDGNPQDVTGGVAVKIQIDDPDLRESYRSGDWDGVSVFGPAVVEQVDLKTASQRVAARMGGKHEMNKEELQAALAASEAKMSELIKSTIATALKPKESKADGDDGDGKPTAEQPPTFTGDVSDPQALADYAGALKGFEMRKAIASGDMDAAAVAEMVKSMTEVGLTVDQLNEAGIKADSKDTKEVRELQTKLFKAQKRSNAPERVGTEQVDEVAELAKSSEAEGLAIAGIMNANMGITSPDNGGMKVHG